MARVLVIDDDQVSLQVVLNALRRTGHEAVGESDSARGLALGFHDDFDIVVIDIFMPEIDGFEIIATLRKSCPGIKIVAVSGVSSEFLKTAQAIGADLTLKKPLSPTELIERLTLLERETPGKRVVES